jgi:tetratricopeptide (TPR) repeat protein
MQPLSTGTVYHATAFAKWVLPCLTCLTTAQSYGQSADGYYLNAVNLVNAGNWSQAMGQVQKAIELDAEHLQGIYLRAYIHLQTGNKDRALADYNHLLDKHPTHEGALNNRALIYMERGKYNEALSDLEKRLKADPSWQAHYDKAYCLALMERYKEAMAEFDKVLEMNPGYAPAYANKGHAGLYLRTGGGLVKPKPEVLKEPCDDLKTALSLGDTTVVKTIEKYCKLQ